MNNLQITDVTLSASSSNGSPTSNNNQNTTIKADDLNLQNLVDRQSRNNNNGASSPVPRIRTSSSNDSGGLTTINRSRTESNTSLNNISSNQGGNPGGSADTRRRITKLSKVREREKVPRLVEYFVVVSSTPVDNNSNTDQNGGSGGGGGNSGDMQYSGIPPASPRRKNVTKVIPTPLSPRTNEPSDTTTAAESTNNIKLDGTEFIPKVTTRYPTKDYDDNPLLVDSVTAFCYPSGKVPVGGKDDGNTMPKVHYFVTTGESGQKMYGTCLTVWEGHEVTVSVSPESDNMKKVQKKKKKEIGRRNIGDKAKSTLSVDTGTTQQEGDGTTTSTQIVYLPKCLVILSMHPYLVAFREYLTQLHRLSKMVPPSSTSINEAAAESSSGNKKMGIVTTSTSASSSIMKQVLTLPIERYITNFCSELPAPPPGSFQVQTTILDSTISIWSPPYNLPLPWVSLPFSHLFQCLDVENVLKVWTALALERQVLVTSTQLSLLTTCCEILLSLLFPMKWSHAYIPVLPHFLVPILSAPMPFLCGIDKRHLADTFEDLSDECIVVDLDKNMVSLGTNTRPLPTLPKFIYQRLVNKVENNAGHVHREVRSLRKDHNTSEMGIHLPPDVKSMADAMWESRLCLFDEAFMLMFTPEERRKNWLNGDNDGGNNDPSSTLLMTLSEKKNLSTQSPWDAVQESFLETYCFLLQKYRKFLVFPSKQNEGAYGGAGFRSQEFLEAQRGDVRDFLEELVGSQMFDDFVTKRLYGSGEADISFFDSAVDRYVRNNGLVANVRGIVRERNNGAAGGKEATPRGSLRKMIKERTTGGGGGASSNAKENDPPMLQSAHVKRELKTIVPPEPCGVDLPESVAEGGVDNAMVVHVTTKREEVNVGDEGDDDVSVTSASTAASHAKQTGRVYYHYPTFPEELDETLFGTPRPMSSAVRAEYDRQRENVGKFRRTNSGNKNKEDGNEGTGASSARSAAVTGQTGPVEKPATSEVTTFTVFFMTFTAVVGKDLMAIDNEALDQVDSKAITSTFKRGSSHREEADEESQNIADMVNDIVMDADLPQTPTKKERAKKSMVNLSQESPVRDRFNDKLSTLKIMEARETAKAELAIAFEMLKMMKERGLRADPEAYQCLIDACGRCGDTDRATQLLASMHEDGIVADGVVYSSLVSAFSSDNAWKQASGEARGEELPDWANGASIDMDWNTLKVQRRSYVDMAKDIAKEKLGAAGENGEHPAGLRGTFKRMVSRNKSSTNAMDKKEVTGYTEQYVTDHVLRQILLGENLLEIVYPDISIDTDNEFCPRCNYYLSDDDVVAGWSAGNSQEYKTECPNCLQKFVPHFCVQSTLPSFVGSRGPSSALFCERLSPWVLKKELRSVISGGIEDLLSPEWREKESKNAVLFWNLILSFMRYRFPFTFLLQGSFSSSLIAPTPDEEVGET